MNAVAAVPATDAGFDRPSRVGAVFRLHFVNPTTVAWMPLLIFGFIFAMNWLIWLIVNLSTGGAAREGMSEGTTWSGASAFIFVWLLVVAVQSMNRTFPFALGFGASRRDYYLGTVAALVILCVGWAVIFGVLGFLEEATDGWGMGGHIFAANYFGDDGPVARAWYVLLLMLYFTGLGLIAGTLWVRWRTWGLIAYFVALGVIIIGGLAAIALTNSWAAVGAFFVGLGFAGSYPLFLIPFAICVVVGYLALRKATARN